MVLKQYLHYFRAANQENIDLPQDVINVPQGVISVVPADVLLTDQPLRNPANAFRILDWLLLLLVIDGVQVSSAQAAKRWPCSLCSQERGYRQSAVCQC